MKTRPRRLLLLSALLLLAGSPEAQSVHVVDWTGGPGSEYLTIGEALAASSDGDVILIRDGTYAEGILLDGLGVVLQAEAGATVRATGTLLVKNLAAGQVAALDRIDVLTVQLEDDAGPVWLQGVECDDPYGLGVASIRDCATVVLRDCGFVPGTILSPGTGDPGLAVVRSDVALYKSRIEGHRGDTGGAWFGGTGGPGLSAEDACVTLYASTVVGGPGEDALPGSAGGMGGVGVELLGASRLERIGSSVSGGMGGEGGSWGYPGIGGEKFSVAPTSTLTTTNSAVRIFTGPSPLRSREEATVTFQGVPGDQVFLLIDTAPRAFGSAPNSVGPLVVSPTALLFKMGSIPAGGKLTRTLKAPPVQLGVKSFYMQGVFANGTLREVGFGTPSQMHVLDPSL